MIGDFSSRLFLPSVTYLNLVKAEFLVLALFLSYYQGEGCPLSCCCADIKTTYSMGTAAMTLLAAPLSLGTQTSFDSANGVGATFHTTVRVNAGRFSAVGVGVMLPISLLLVPPFTLRLG